MDWLFERLIELAAWAAFILGLVFLCDTLWWLFHWVSDIGGESSATSITKSCEAAVKFVGSALALGALACIDRYVFDLPEEA